MSFFARVSRHAGPAQSDPRENRLTEIFAAVLERVDGLASELAQRWLGDELATLTLVDLRTQRPTRGGGFIDLELRFGAGPGLSADDIVVWVEVKHGAAPHAGQLEGYLRDVATLGVRAGFVVLLAPRQSYPFVPAPPPEVALLRWQDTAPVLSARRDRAGEEGFLVRELLRFLDEEGLMDPEVITPVHLVALAERAAADRAIALATELAGAYVGEHWNDRADRPRRPGLGYWETYPPAPRDATAAEWPGVWWDWNLFESDLGLPGSRGGIPVFAAGLCAPRGQDIFGGSAGAAWALDLERSHGFVGYERGHRRFTRLAYPEQVLVGRTLQEQSESVGRWVVETFSALAAAGRPLHN